MDNAAARDALEEELMLARGFLRLVVESISQQAWTMCFHEILPPHSLVCVFAPAGDENVPIRLGMVKVGCEPLVRP
jgi:hypothetical protein